MATYRRPGAYVEEVTLVQSVQSQGLETSLAAFVGAALRGPVTAPFYVGSWTDFTRRFGQFRSASGAQTYDLALAVYQFFSNGGRGAWIQRVVGTGSNSATTTFQDSGAQNVLTVNAIDPGDWAVGNLYAQITDVYGSGTNGAVQNGDTFSLVLFNGGTSPAYVVERWTDLSLDPNAARYAPNVVNGQSAWVSLVRPTATGTLPPSSNSVPVALANPTGVTGSLDGATPAASDYSAAADLFDTVPSNLIFNIPDAFHLSSTDSASVYNNFIVKADSRGDAFVVVDVPSSITVVADALTWANQINASGNAAIYWPSVLILNPVPGGGQNLVNVAAGGGVIGVYHSTDASRGVFKSPAGVGASLNNVVDVSVRFSPSDLDSMNTAVKPINAIKPVPGAGICIMGARTLAGTRDLRYIGARRTMLEIKKALTDRTQFAVMENNDSTLWQQVTTACSVYLNGLWQAGGLKGTTPQQAYYVICDSTNNPQSSIDSGALVVEVGVALQTPAEFVIIRIGQFDGSTSVTEQN